MLQIKQRSEETASAADEMNRYCGDLAEKQKQVSLKVDNMNDVFFTAISSLHKIKDETADIVNKMKNVSAASDESFRNLTELENVLEEFKTGEVQEEETEVTDNVAAETTVETEVSENKTAVDSEEIDDDIEEIGEEGMIYGDNEVPAAEQKQTYNSPSIAEIDAKLNELAMTGGFGISLEESEEEKPDTEEKSETMTEEQ